MKSQRTARLDSLFATPPLADLHPAEARLLLAIRRGIGARATERDMGRAIATLFPHPGAAQRLILFLEILGQAWPERFSVGSPCCHCVNPDEWTLIQLMRCVAVTNRPAFDAQLCEMVDSDSRDRIYGGLADFLATFRR